MQTTEYQIISQNESKKLTQFLCKEGQLLLPMVELITQAEMAIDELIGVTGRAAIEAFLRCQLKRSPGQSTQVKKPGISPGMASKVPPFLYPTEN